jgi:hypothetical protein
MSSFSPSTVSRKVFADRLRFDDAALVRHLAERQQMALEHLVDRLEIEVGAHVDDGEISAIEGADRVRLVEIAGDAALAEKEEIEELEVEF